MSSRVRSILQAFLVTFLWSTSWVLIKIGLQDIPALTFAGLRYSMAFLCLLPLALHPTRRVMLSSLSKRQWTNLFVLGVIFYAITQGAQFLGLAYLPAVTVSLLLNLTTIVVALLGMIWLTERPGIFQWTGIILSAAGALVYFLPLDLPFVQITGLVIVLAGVLANALSSVLGRQVNRRGDIPPLIVTTASMGIGGLLLLASGLAFQGMPHFTLTNWTIVVWLAVVNTALAFTLWNHTLRTLTAVESSIINSTMLVQIALLAWIFLGETLNWKEIAGLIMAGAGALIVQLRRAA